MVWAVVASLAIHALLIFVVVSREPELPAVARGHVLAATIAPGRAAVDGDGSGLTAVREPEAEQARNAEPAPAVWQESTGERKPTPDSEPDSLEHEPADMHAEGGSEELLSAADSGSGEGAASGSADRSPSVAARVEPPRSLERIVPEYPRIARRRGLEGEVVIRVTISLSGDPLTAEIVSPSDHRVLNDAAIAAVQAARFQPGRVGDQPTEMSLSIRIVFELS